MAAGDQWGPAISNGVGDNARRQAAVKETDAALNIARQIPASVFVVHLGTPTVTGGREQPHGGVPQRRGDLPAGGAIGIRVALEVIPNPLSDARVAGHDDRARPRRAARGHLPRLRPRLPDGRRPDTIETVAEHLATTHVHDNNGKKDDHLVPFDGRINWSVALMTMQKVGYDGTYLMELASTGEPDEVLKKAHAARGRFEKLLAY